MDREKVKLIIRNMELLVDSLKAEIYFDESNTGIDKNVYLEPNDYDEIFED
jgi:hypothetical protein